MSTYLCAIPQRDLLHRLVCSPTLRINCPDSYNYFDSFATPRKSHLSQALFIQTTLKLQRTGKLYRKGRMALPRCYRIISNAAFRMQYNLSCFDDVLHSPYSQLAYQKTAQIESVCCKGSSKSIIIRISPSSSAGSVP